jgi:glutamate--cysteine ligase
VEPLPVPRLTTALSGPLPELERAILAAMHDIEHWLRSQWQERETPFYCSVDLRNSGLKIAPVDTNLFPGGFNNLNPEFEPLCVHAAMTALEKICPDARGAVLVPENHTRNTHYLKNVAALAKILRHAGMHVRIGTLMPEVKRPTDLELPGGGTLTLEPLQRKGNRVAVGDFDPCVVILNNDLSAGIPAVLRNLEQALLPPLHAGWARCGASRIISTPTAMSRKTSPKSSASTRGSSIRTSGTAAASISTAARARSASRATSPRSWTRCAPNTASTASTRSLS